MKLRSLLSVLSVIALLCCTLLPVSAESRLSTDQTLTLTYQDDKPVFTAKQKPAFWEAPSLTAGERVTVDGTLILENCSGKQQEISLQQVDFPFGDLEAMRYFNHLFLTISDANTTYYDGAYSHMNDDGAITLKFLIGPNEFKDLTIRMYCDYTYTGNNFPDQVINWRFAVDTPDTSSDNSESDQAQEDFSDPMFWRFLLFLPCSALVFGVLLLRRRKKDRP